MPFQKGHKLSTGRPNGARNKELSEAKKILNKIIFEPQSIIDDFNNLDVKGRMEFRCRMARFVIPEQKAVEIDQQIDSPRLSLSDIQRVYNTDEEELPQHKD
tara:strand:+ start:1578 stop:1883 length:306 start_codon:yes stop_codon:yes gene_type:complete